MQQFGKKELPKLKLNVDFSIIPSPDEGNEQNTNRSMSSTGNDLNDYQEVFKIGEDVMAEVSTRKCGRLEMEDRFTAQPNLNNQRQFFYAVYDGHGGSYVSRMLSKNLHFYLTTNNSFKDNIEQAIFESYKELNNFILNQQIEKGRSGGSTALCAINRYNQLYIVNLGDSTCYLVKQNCKLLKMNSEHKPSRQDEAERIQQQGFLIYKKNIARIDGELAVSRSFGDKNYIKSGLIAEPEINKTQITNEDQFLILGTDGFWDVIIRLYIFTYFKLIEVQELEELLKIWQQQNGGTMENLTQYLINTAISKQTSFKKDNITLLVIDLRKYYISTPV